MRMIAKLIPLILVLTSMPSRSSLVVDSEHHQGVYMTDYCPSMKFCREGSHVLCRYYDPHKVVGPNCLNWANVTITAELASQMLEIINTIRSRVANGRERGKDGELLPRAYGMFRLKWDSELATFAQVLANQCNLKHDDCRATKRFPNPSQTVTMIRFQYPDWKSWMNTVKSFDETPGVTSEKQAYAAQLSIKTWYSGKAYITDEMIKVYPDVATIETDAAQYLSMVHGSATHMGCGMSGFSTYSDVEGTTQGLRNNLLLVCNFSAGARRGMQTYETDPPIPDQGYSLKCGCPPGSTEDDDCLCNEMPVQNILRDTGVQERCNHGISSGSCNPTLVLLPIFIEEVPLHNFYQIADELRDPLRPRIENSSDGDVTNRLKLEGVGRQPEELLAFLHEKELKNDIWHSILQPMPMSSRTRSPLQKREQQTSSTFLGPASSPPTLPPRRINYWSQSSLHHTHLPPPPVPQRIPPPIPPRIPPRVDRYLTGVKTDPKPTVASCDDKWCRPAPKLPPRQHPVTKKFSTFTNIPQFQLSKRKKMPSTLEVIEKSNSNLRKFVDDYVNQNLIDDNQEHYDPKETQKLKEDISETHTPETGLNKAEEVVINFHQHFKHRNVSIDNDKDVDIKEENDNKLMNLLDNLEKEVKHVALDGNERELFDVKLRKIYGTVIGKAAYSQFPNSILQKSDKKSVELEDIEIDFGDPKSIDNHDHNHGKYIKHHKISKTMEGRKNYLDHKRKNTLINNYVDNRSSEVISHKYNDNFDHLHYVGIDHHYNNDLDLYHKYDEDLNKKKSVNNLDLEYNDVNHKFTDNHNHEHHNRLVKIHDDDLPSSIINKYASTKTVFREFGNSQEDASRIAEFHKHTIPNHVIPDKGLVTKDIEKLKKRERIHRNKVKSLTHNEFEDQLDLERRKYYQEKLNELRKKVHGARKSRHDSKDDRSTHLHTKDHESATLKSKADDFYMPDRPGFLHGF